MSQNNKEEFKPTTDQTPVCRIINYLNHKCVEASRGGDLQKMVEYAELSNKVEEVILQIKKI
tara:strand:- start:179 stop:364 length:186 start_codon:yes stop_codon:yes gene_type:complete